MTSQFVSTQLPAKRLLIIEDDLSLQNVYKTLFTKEKLDVVSVTTVEQAKSVTKNGMFDCIILDIMLPNGQNGFDFLEYLCQDVRYKKVPILVLTNLNQDQNSAKEMGVTEWLVKSDISAQEIVNKVKMVMKA
ncbi:response regulator [Patescibacteria group bacterium]|nr:response regulator [Patescibacteria group bacterium]